MADDLNGRVGALEHAVSGQATSIQRLESRQTRLESMLEEMRRGVESIDDHLSTLSTDVRGLTHEALRSWPEDAVQAIASERQSASRTTHILVGLLGAAAAIIASLTVIAAQIHP